MRHYFFIFSLTLFSGCAFRESTTPGALPALSVAMDWSGEPSVLLLGKKLKNTRILSSQGDREFTTQEATTLPISAPKTFYLAVELPAKQMSGPVEFLKTSLKLESGTQDVDSHPFEMVSNPASEEAVGDDKRRVVVQVAGLNSAFPADRSQEGILTLRFYSKKEFLAQVSVRLRTPPSRLEMRHLHLREWLAERGEGQIPLDQPEIADKRMNLIRVVRITNQERRRVELQIPRRPRARFRQQTIGLTYRDQGCSFSISERPEWYEMADEVLLLPLNAQFFPQAKESFTKELPEDLMSLRIESGATADVGLYAIGAPSDQWMSNGPLGPELVQQTVNNGCGRSCDGTECYGGRGDMGLGRLSSPSSMSQVTLAGFSSASRGRKRFSFKQRNPIQLATCHCVSWTNYRTTAVATLGTNRLPVELDVEDSSRLWPVRFADLDFSLDSETRTMPALETSSQVVWK